MGGTWSPGPHRRGWLGESGDATQGPSKWAGEWLRWAECGRRVVTLIEAPPPSLERRDPLRSSGQSEERLQDGMVTILPLPCPNPWAVMGRFPGRNALASWPDHVQSWRAPLRALPARVAFLPLLRGLKTRPSCLLTHASPSPFPL